MQIALTTGVTGQYGAYLAKFPREKFYPAVGITRRAAPSDFPGPKLRWPGNCGLARHCAAGR